MPAFWLMVEGPGVQATFKHNLRASTPVKFTLHGNRWNHIDEERIAGLMNLSLDEVKEKGLEKRIEETLQAAKAFAESMAKKNAGWTVRSAPPDKPTTVEKVVATVEKTKRKFKRKRKEE